MPANPPPPEQERKVDLSDLHGVAAETSTDLEVSEVDAGIESLIPTDDVQRSPFPKDRSVLSKLVVGLWGVVMLGSIASIIADWVTWEEIDVPVTAVSTAALIVVGFYFGNQQG